MGKSKVAVVACPDYEPARVKESLQKGLEAIGGLESLIGKEENILLNQTSSAPQNANAPS